VIDDFGHNPDKVSATLAALKQFPGRVLAFFQPHGFGPLRKMGRELAAAFARHLDGDDRLIVCDPAYFGGTVDRSVGSDILLTGMAGRAEHIPDRADCGLRLVELARPGDRILVMGARDDSLSVFARGILEGVAKSRETT
jgi:UDP-N-acetylmuramate--alanine ligase